MRSGSCSRAAAAWRRSSCAWRTPRSASCAGGRAARTSRTPRCLRMVGDTARARARALALARVGDRGGGRRLRPGAARPQAHRPRRHRGARRGAGHRSDSRGTGVLIARAVPARRPDRRVARPCADDRAARDPGGERRRAWRRGESGGRGCRGRRDRAGRRRRAAGPRRGCARRRARGGAERVLDQRLAEPAGRRPRRPLPRRHRRRCSPRTSARPRARGCSPSRTPAPTGCCCPR